MTQPLISARLTFFHGKSATIVFSRNTDIDCILLNTESLILLSLFWVFNSCFSKYGCNLMILAKLATLGFLKIKLFWNKGYDVTISINSVTSKTLAHE